MGCVRRIHSAKDMEPLDNMSKFWRKELPVLQVQKWQKRLRQLEVYRACFQWRRAE